jgi:hypothetical protein
MRLLTRRPKGVVRLFHRGRLLYECENLIVNSGLTALANLLGGTTAGEFVAFVGFGSGSTPPAPTDVALTTGPFYYNAVSTVTIGPSGGVASGSVQFGYQLQTTDYAANLITIQELGLFGNTGGANFPAAVSTLNPAWSSGHNYAIGDMIVDSNNNIERCTVAGTSAGTHPTWPTILGNTVGDGGVTWTLVALHTAPVPMISHVVVPAFPYTGTGNFSGVWTVSM